MEVISMKNNKIVFKRYLEKPEISIVEELRIPIICIVIRELIRWFLNQGYKTFT
jgi:hypothetical protein